MASEAVIWTLLPDGFDPATGELRSTIFVSPRLRTGGTREPLDAFPTFRHWPAALEQLKFEAEIDGIGAVELVADDRVGRPDPPTWELLFGGEVFVDELAVRDLGTRRVHSFPADMVASEILTLYAEVAANHPTDHPSIHDPLLQDLAVDLGRIGDHPDEEEAILDRWFHMDESKAALGRTGRFVPPTAARASRANAFLLTNRFYARRRGAERLRDARGPLDPDAVPPRPERPVLDFHRYVAALGDYRHLLRRLGLALDVRMKADPAFAGDQRYRVVVNGDPQPWMNDDSATPWLNYRWSGDRSFVARTREDGRPDVADGQLLLDSADFFNVHQIDIDGSALKATNTASSISRRLALVAGQGETMAPTTSSLPALRGAGLTVVRRDTAQTVVGQFDHTAVHADAERNGTRPDLWADDVIRGYRWEAERDGSGRFQSLVDRVGTYTYHRADGTAVALDLPPDQGYVKGSSTTSVPGDDDLYLHEAIASWSGWSMVAPRPGGGLTPEDEPDKGASPLERDPEALDPGVPLETSFRAAPGSLPVLRYGHDYRLRARTVDLAANSIDPDTLDDGHASAPVRFLRWEPVPAPVLVPRRPYGEGESQLRMVIRSTVDTTVAEYLALPRVQALAAVNVTGGAYLDHDDRWIVPPKTSQQMAELHGVFDDAIGSGDPARIQAAFEIAAREDGALPALAAADGLTTPYLPDVASRGVRFARFFLDPAIWRRHDWPSASSAAAGAAPWWDRQPLRVVMVAGPAPAPVTPAGNDQVPAWDPDTATLTVAVPQAEMRTVRVSSAVDRADLELLGMYHRMLDAADPADLPSRRSEADQSRNWMLTPWVELTFVHAVEKPLADPVIAVTDTGMARRSGESFCVLDGAIVNHAKSTGRLDVEAEWTEQVDDVAETAPADGMNGLDVRRLHGHVGDFLLEAFEDDCRVGRDDVTGTGGKGAVHRLRHEFGDTRHRVVTYHARATTRFREYFPPAVIDGVDEAGESLIVRRGPTVKRHVPSSRRPDPPDIAYVIPTFRWSEEQLWRTGGLVFSAGTRRIRHGGGLRVYLRRPWYSSGDGERLGVVLEDQPWVTWPVDRGLGIDVALADRARADRFAEQAVGLGGVAVGGSARASALERMLRGAGFTAAQVAGNGEPDELRVALSGAMTTLGDAVRDIPFWWASSGIDPEKLLTRVGGDPVFASAPATDGPYIAQFPLRSSVRGGVALAETNKAKVTVVGHTPRFDATRNLWYCDIELDPGAAYQPFVRLALCRYQPHSIDGHHISRVVLADFAQLLPRRVATVRPARGGVRVTLAGPVGVGRLGGSGVNAGAIRSSRMVTAEIQQLPEGGDPDLGWARVGQPVDLTVTVGSGGLGDVSWNATVAVPPAVPGVAARVLVQEFEIHPTDPGDTLDPFDAEWRSGPIEFPTQVRQRLVYADTFAL